MISHSLARYETAKGLFERCLTNLKAKDATDLAGKYVRFRVESPETQRSAQGERPDLVSVFMNSQRTVRFVQPHSNPRNKNEEVSSMITLWLEEEEVGFQPTEMETRGSTFWEY